MTLISNIAGKTKNWQLNLEDALREALDYQSSLNDMVQRLSEIDGQLSASKPVGGLPETAKEQLEEFMVCWLHFSQESAIHSQQLFPWLPMFSASFGRTY